DVESSANAAKRMTRFRMLVAMMCRLLPARPVGGFRLGAGHGGGHRQRTCLHRTPAPSSHAKQRNPMVQDEMQAKSTAPRAVSASPPASSRSSKTTKSGSPFVRKRRDAKPMIVSHRGGVSSAASVFRSARRATRDRQSAMEVLR